jgi:hypothetical protein
MRRIDKDRVRTIKKWSPIIENHLNYKNKSVNDLICVYCEWYVSDPLDLDTGNTLPNILMEIKEKIDSWERIEILGKYFNPASGHVEYKLESGKFIRTKDSDYELSNEDLIELFGIEFIKDLDPQKFRDIQLNKIL